MAERSFCGAMPRTILRILPQQSRKTTVTSWQQRTRRQAREGELDSIFKELKEKHEDKPQLRLWAHMISCGIHDDVDEPPHVPLIVRAPQPKRQKQKSLTSALVGAATALANAISPKPNPGSSSTQQHMDRALPAWGCHQVEQQIFA